MSVNVLLNYYNFDGDWARPHLQKFFKNLPQVLILPIAYRENEVYNNESWLRLYGKGGEKYVNIVRPFLTYGYREEQLRWLDPFDCKDPLATLKGAGVLFFTGGMPEKALSRLETLGLTEAVRRFDGIVAGASAGAMLQLEQYHVTPDEDYAHYGLWRGLGLVGGLDLEVHYLATQLQDDCAARAHRELAIPVYKMWHEGGLLVENGVVTPMGNVEVLE